MIETIPRPFRQVQPPRRDSTYHVQLDESGLLIELAYFTPGGDREKNEGYILIDHDAWEGIVAAVAEVQAEAKGRARREVRVDELLYGDEIDA
jgi:hypothetical protein